MDTLKGPSFQLDHFSSPTQYYTNDRAGRKVRLGALTLVRSRTSLNQCRLIMKLYLALQCSKIFTYIYSASTNLCAVSNFHYSFHILTVQN